MKKGFLVGIAVASFSLSAFAQNNSTPNVNIKQLDQNSTYSPQAGITVQFAKGSNEDNAAEPKKSSANSNINVPMDTGFDSGIGNGAPDMSQIQSQSLANAQAQDKPVDIRSAPEGASEILKQGTQALQAKDSSQIKSSSQPLDSNFIVPQEFMLQDSSFSHSNKENPVILKNTKRNIITSDISIWNQTTIDQFAKDGKERTENRYQEFLSK